MAVSGSTLTIGSPADGTVTNAKVSSGNFVTDFTDTTITASDEILFADSSDSGNEKKDTIQGILDLVPAPAGGDKRNFIIDGDFTQWPEGTTIANTEGYGPALFQASVGGGTPAALNMIEETTVLPTFAQSGHQSASCLKLDVTTALASIAAGDQAAMRHYITGTDYKNLHQREATLAFWVRSPKTGTHAVAFFNNAANRSYVATYTVSSADTWEYITITLTFDTTGTWEFTEDKIGVYVVFTLLTGTTRHASAANTWEAGEFIGVAGIVNVLDNTANNFYISQVGLYLGSTAPTFTSPPIATVKDQVEFYVETSYDSDVATGTATNNSSYGGLGVVGSGLTPATTADVRVAIPMRTKRDTPTITVWDLAGTVTKWSRYSNVGGSTANNIAATTDFIGHKSFRVKSSSVVAKFGILGHWMADSRH
jgi:hypothetical protein